MTTQEISKAIINDLKTSLINKLTVIETVSYENQISEMAVEEVVNKMIRQGWITETNKGIKIRFPYIINN
jgi:hypothetical protein